MQISTTLYFQYTALSLLIVGGLVTASSWAFVVKSADDAARTWFAAVAMQLTSGMTLFAAGTEYRETAYFFAAIILVSSLYLALYSTTLMLKMDARRELLTVWVAHLFVFCFLYVVVGRQEAAFVVSVIAVAVLEGLMVLMLGQVRSHLNLTATLFAEVAFGAALLGSLTRLLGAFFTGKSILYTDLSIYSAIAMSMQGVLIIMSCFFYIGLSIQRVETREVKMRLEANQLRLRQKMAEDHARETQKLIGERDQMMILNSRFSAVSTLSLLGASVVHEIAQPLQAARSAMDVLALERGLTPNDLAKQTDAVLSLIDRASNVVENLRRLIREKSIGLEDIDCQHLLRRVFPIFASEAKRRSVAASFVFDELAIGKRVRANPVMLERVMFNLAVNALEAFEGAPPETAVGTHPRKLLIDVRVAAFDAGECLVIGVHDTAIGVAGAAYDEMFELLSSSKEAGTGLGLYLVKTFVESWNGAVTAKPNQYEEQGTTIEIALPTVAVRQHELLASRQ